MKTRVEDANLLRSIQWLALSNTIWKNKPFMVRYNYNKINTNRGVAQLGSASALGAEGRRFKSCHPDKAQKIFGTI